MFTMKRMGFAAVILINAALFTLCHSVGAAINHGDYTPFSMGRSVSPVIRDTTYLYMPGPAKFYRSGYLGSELAVFELRHVLSGYPTIHYVLVGGAALALGNLERGMIFCQALFPTLVWLCFYRLARFGLEESLAAAAVAWGCCLFSLNPRTLLALNWAFPASPLDLIRTPQPSISLLVFLIAILALEWSTRANRSWWSAAGAGMVSGLLFYAYYFYTVAFFLGLALWLAASILRRGREWPCLIGYGAGGALVGAPYLWITLQAMRTHQQTALQARVGEFTHSMNVGAMIGFLLALAAFGLLYWKFGARLESTHLRVAIPLAAMFVAGVAGLNLQVLSGYDPQSAGHFPNRVIRPLGFLLLAGWLFMDLEKRLAGKRKLWQAGCVAVSLTLLVLAAVAQVRSGIANAAAHRLSDPRMDMALWVRNHLPYDVVVSSSDDRLLALIPAIAGAWTFVPPGDTTLASNQEILTRFLIASRLEGQDWPQAEAHLRQDSGEITNLASTSYVLFTRRRLTLGDDWMRDAHQLWAALDVPRELRTRRLDYLILRRDASSAWGGQAVYQNRDWQVVPFRTAPPH